MAFNTAYFSRMPESKIGHSKFKRPFCHAGTMMHGDIVPIYCKLVSPGEIIREKFAGNIRMSTPISPIYSSIKVSYNAFFVPLRLVWEHTKEFFGENTTGAGVPIPGTYTIPMTIINSKANSGATYGTRVKVHSVAHYLGLPLYKGGTLDDETYNLKASVLKIRAYWSIINEWYRHEQIQAPITISTSDSGGIGQKNGSWLHVEDPCQKCLKDFDYFTTLTIAPDFGPDVTLPLGSSAPIIAGSFHALGSNGEELVLGNASAFGPGNGNYANAYLVGDPNHGTRAGLASKSGEATSVGTNTFNKVTHLNLEADLRSATAASLNEFFLAAAAQTWYYNANYGSRYFEMLQVHYKVTNPDLVLQRPEHIGEAKRYIQVQQVLSTAGAASDASTKLGQPGANSSTNVEVDFGSHSFGEWGFFMILANTYHEHYYTAGIQREDLYEEMFDFFFPEFSNIGSMSVLRSEAFAASSVDPSEILGYQEAWSEMRYTNNRLSGLFDPYVNSDNGITGYTSPLKGWVTSEKWISKPLLNEQFILENRDSISSLLVTGTNGPDYIFYYYFDESTISEVPVFSKPGLPGRGRGIL